MGLIFFISISTDHIEVNGTGKKGCRNWEMNWRRGEGRGAGARGQWNGWRAASIPPPPTRSSWTRRALGRAAAGKKKGKEN